MEIVVVSLLNGLVYGMLLFMLASGLTLIFSMMGVLNFAHASIYMIGAYLAFTGQPVGRLLSGADHCANPLWTAWGGDRGLGPTASSQQRAYR